MRGAISPLPLYVFMAWCLVKHRDNFTFYLMSCHRIAGQNLSVFLICPSIMSEFEYLPMSVANYIALRRFEEQFKSRNTCCHSVQNVLGSSLFSENFKIKKCTEQ
jgi:hypothetical protein